MSVGVFRENSQSLRIVPVALAGVGRCGGSAGEGKTNGTWWRTGEQERRRERRREEGRNEREKGSKEERTEMRRKRGENKRKQEEGENKRETTTV